MKSNESDKSKSNLGSGMLVPGEPDAGKSCTSGSEGGVRKRTNNPRRTPNGPTANRPLPWVGNAPRSYLTNNAVEGLMNYLADKAEKPVTYMYTPPAGTPPRTGHYAKFPISVHDGRALHEQFSLDTQGFAFRNHETKVTNFYDDNEVRSIYYPEVERLVKEVNGTTKVLVFDHNVRCSPTAQRGENGVREPVRMAHNDYTLKSGPQRVRDLLPDEAEELLKHRFAVINVWRPIRGPVQESPLAVCDAQSIKQEDYVAMDLVYHDRVGEVYVMNFNPNHRWYYLPQQQRNEVIFLKGYDSDPTKARFTAHSAFDDPTIPPNAQARESIEVRTLVFFAPEN